MRIFITGIAGFLGSHLADYLRNEGHYVFGCDNFFGGEVANVPQDMACIEVDIGDADGMYRMLSHADIVYHCAAAAYEGASVFAPAFISQNIYGGSAAVFSAAIRAGVGRIVNCSSMARYGIGFGRPSFETDSLRPADPYGIAKAAAERLLENLGAAHVIEWNTAVPHNIYGPRQRYIDPYRNVAAIFANLMLQGRPPIIYGDGEQVRSFSFVDDVVPCLARLGTDPAIVYQTVNLGPDEDPITVTALARRLARIIGFKGDPIYVDSRPQEVKVATCSADKARKLLGYKTTVALDDGLDRLVRFIRDRGPRPFEYHFDLEIRQGAPRAWTERMF